MESSRTDSKFDRLVGSKVVEVLMSRLDVAGMGYLLENYQCLLVGGTTSPDVRALEG